MEPTFRVIIAVALIAATTIIIAFAGTQTHTLGKLEPAHKLITTKRHMRIGGILETPVTDKADNRSQEAGLHKSGLSVFGGLW